MTYSEYADRALTLPEVTEKLGKLETDLVRDHGHMSRLREKGTVLAVRLPWELIEELLARFPGVFYLHPHYKGYPYIAIKVDDLTEEIADILIQESWKAAITEIPRR